MDYVKIKTPELLASLKANRDKHADAFRLALSGYRIEAAEWFDAAATAARSEDGKIERALPMPEPQNHTSDYEQVIRMLEMSADDTVQLDREQFRNYVMDEWSWSGVVAASNHRYHGKAGSVAIGR